MPSKMADLAPNASFDLLNRPQHLIELVDACSARILASLRLLASHPKSLPAGAALDIAVHHNIIAVGALPLSAHIIGDQIGFGLSQLLLQIGSPRDPVMPSISPSTQRGDLVNKKSPNGNNEDRYQISSHRITLTLHTVSLMLEDHTIQQSYYLSLGFKCSSILELRRLL